MIWGGFLIGLSGSLHCVGMCGPLAMALPVPVGKNRMLWILVYNFGRITTYAILGAAFGMIGKSFEFVGLQQYLSVFAGVALLIMLAFSFWKPVESSGFSFFAKASMLLRSKLSALLARRTLSSMWMIGVLNGLLPCGLIYAAITGAIAMGEVFSGALFMAAFGLGTLPAMFATAMSGNLLTNSLRAKFKRIVPYTVALMSLLLILRGLNLGIPYLSPQVKNHQMSCCKK